MTKVHVECLPDETLVKILGITKKMVTHHTGKSRVFHKLKTAIREIAMVDEDPESAKTEYERNLIFVEERFGIKKYTDKKENIVLVLKVKLEDWIIDLCKVAKIDISKFGLPEKPNQLHDVINLRLPGFEKLIEYLKNNNNERINQLKNWLNQ